MEKKYELTSETVFVDSDLTFHMQIEDRKDSKVQLSSDLFPEVTWENSPQRLKLF